MFITISKSVLLVVLLATHILADFSPIFPRQSTYTCDAGYSLCNKHCMPSGSTCCSDGSYCLSTQYCTTGDNGLGACCQRGKLCSGNGGTSSYGTTTRTSTTSTRTTATTTSTGTSTSTGVSVIFVPTGSASSGSSGASNIEARGDYLAAMAVGLVGLAAGFAMV
ncbi:hypothetical protein BGZ60DRAFT_414192 [Tricladium varicosporioides]|nr:hypothetical protein BGZ60DRAFT_414192 [Hymenoscyphus varicosporioides]